jgi:hypothetical protein
MLVPSQILRIRLYSSSIYAIPCSHSASSSVKGQREQGEGERDGLHNHSQPPNGFHSHSGWVMLKHWILNTEQMKAMDAMISRARLLWFTSSASQNSRDPFLNHRPTPVNQAIDFIILWLMAFSAVSASNKDRPDPDLICLDDPSPNCVPA